MKTNSISHKDVIDRFVSYGESNFETTSVNNHSDTRSKEQLGVLRLIYAYRFSGHLRAKLDPLNRPRHHATQPFKISEFGLNDTDLDKTFGMGSYQDPNCTTLRELLASLEKHIAVA